MFIEQIKAGQPLTVTDPGMTRFLMDLEEAIDLVIFAFENAKAGDLMVKKAPACRIGDLALALKICQQRKPYPYQCSGLYL